MSIKKNKIKEEINEDIEIPEYTDKDIKQKFPSLYGELAGEAPSKLSSNDIKEILVDEPSEDLNLVDNQEIDSDTESEIRIVVKNTPMEKDYLRGFDPQATDFIRRAKTSEEALEILNYLENRGELSNEDCKGLKKQLREEGLESFGEHKTHGYYFEYQRKKHMEEKMKLSGKQPGK